MKSWKWRGGQKKKPQFAIVAASCGWEQNNMDQAEWNVLFNVTENRIFSPSTKIYANNVLGYTHNTAGRTGETVVGHDVFL